MICDTFVSCLNEPEFCHCHQSLQKEMYGGWIWNEFIQLRMGSSNWHSNQQGHAPMDCMQGGQYPDKLSDCQHIKACTL